MLFFWSAVLNSVCHYLINATTIVFLHCFYDVGFLWHKKKALIFLLGAVIQTALCFVRLDNYTIINEVFAVFYCFVAVYDYAEKKLRAALRFWIYTVFVQSLIVIYGILATFCVSQELYDTFAALFSTQMDTFYVDSFTLSMSDTLIPNILGIIFFSAIFFFLYSAYKKGVVIRCGKQEIWLVIGVSILSYIFVLIVVWGMLTEDSGTLRYALALLGILWAFLFPVFIYYTRISEYYRKRTAFQEQHIQAELAHFQQHQKTQEETARFRHDIRNNLHCIKDLLEQSKSEEALEYLTDLLNVSKNLSAKYVTGDALLDSIVGVKAQIMEQYHIQFKLDGVLAGGLPWKPMDICNVFANALDNAIEACQKVDPEKRSISMNIRSTPQFWFVTIENSVAKAVDVSKLFRKNAGYTSKSNAARHGLGTYNMKYTVESYGAMIKAECTKESFKLEIMIDKSNPKGSAS